MFQPEVSMAIPDSISSDPSSEQVCSLLEKTVRPVLDLFISLSRDRLINIFLRLLKVLIRVLLDPLRFSKTLDIFVRLCNGIEKNQFLGDLLHHLRSDLPSFKQ